ncbi:MAG TPA: YajQ family cyclic di-GMP-binding protein [Candidatus Nitrosotenuis sp.]|nr:YajQ family cyclic di-GMP-binding protein [Candidatus Nitrosotenuis sp.]
MATFSFDIVSEYDKAEINNVLASAQREISNRYDFKNTPAAIEWLGDKAGYKVTGAGEWQIESIVDIIRKNLANRGQSSKTLDLTKPIVETNMKATQEIPFVEGLDQDKAKQITRFLKENHPKIKTQIQGDAVRITSGSKNDLQDVMKALSAQEFDFTINYTNFR